MKTFVGTEGCVAELEDCFFLKNHIRSGKIKFLSCAYCSTMVFHTSSGDAHKKINEILTNRIE